MNIAGKTFGFPAGGLQQNIERERRYGRDNTMENFLKESMDYLAREDGEVSTWLLREYQR